MDVVYIAPHRQLSSQSGFLTQDIGTVVGTALSVLVPFIGQRVLNALKVVLWVVLDRPQKVGSQIGSIRK